MSEIGSSLKCGFIGLGSQGLPMARRMLDAGLPVTLWARRVDSLIPFRDTGAGIAASPADLAAQVDHLGICVVNDADVQQVCREVIPAMHVGACIAIHSTVHPETCRVLAKQAAARGVCLIDAPVSGGAPAAEAGMLTVMVGGKASEVEAARPILSTFGRLIVHLGDVGAGQIGKLVNNALLAANISVAHYALLAGLKLGIAREALVHLMLASSARSFGLEVCGRMTYPSSFAHGAALLEKDLRLLGQLGKGDAAVSHLENTAGPFIQLALGISSSRLDSRK